MWNNFKLFANIQKFCIWLIFQIFSGGKPSNQLLKAYLQTIETVLCQFYFTDQDALPNGLMDTQLCAKDLQFNRDTCQVCDLLWHFVEFILNTFVY